MSLLVRQLCWQHPEREASGRCTACRHFFCRECLTEHGEVLLCAGCLVQSAASPRQSGTGRGTWLSLAGASGGLLLAWLCFYLMGRLLLLLPTSFHQAALWAP